MVFAAYIVTVVLVDFAIRIVAFKGSASIAYLG